MMEKRIRLSTIFDAIDSIDVDTPAEYRIDERQEEAFREGVKAALDALQSEFLCYDD